MNPLKEYFKEHPHTEVAIAKQLRITREYIRQLKEGVKTPGLRLAGEIEKLTGVSIRSWHQE